MKAYITKIARLLIMLNQHRVAMLSLIIFGFLLLHFSKTIFHYPYTDISIVIHELGILFVTIVPIIFIYERILRNLFLHEMERVTTNVVSHFIPDYIKNFKDSGVRDIYNRLRFDELLAKIGAVQNTKIRFLKIWIPSIEAITISLYDAITNRNCEVEILLLDPSCEEAIIKRGRAYGSNLKRIQDNINSNIFELRSLYHRLPEDKRSKLTFKTHRDFVSISLIGIENYFITGFYLHGKLSTEGTQLKVHGRESFFYDDLYWHFKHQWKNAEVFDLSVLPPDEDSPITSPIKKNTKGSVAKNSN